MSALNLDQIPFPSSVQALTFEEALAFAVDAFVAQFPADAAEAAELGEPSQAEARVIAENPEGSLVRKLLQAFAYRDQIKSSEFDEQTKASAATHSTGADLDNLAVNYGVVRLVIDEGDPDADPIVPPTYESDSALRRRMILAIDAPSTAGSVGAYTYHALSASGSVKNVAVDSPSDGAVRVAVLSQIGNGEPDLSLVLAVEDALTDRRVRPLTDHVTVEAATIVEYDVEAVLHLFDGPDASLIREEADSALIDYANRSHDLGTTIARSGISGALHRPGVERVELISPPADIVNNSRTAAYMRGVSVTVG